MTSTNSNYDPDTAAIPTGVVYTAQLSQRDLSLNVPINFATHAGVSLQSACFAGRRYEDTAARKCFSNLLAAGFRRLVVDVYWDSSRQLWSLCPVELGSVASGNSTASSPSASPATVTSASLSTAQLTSDGSLVNRQESTSVSSLGSSSGQAATTASPTTTLTESVAANSASTSASSIEAAPTVIPGSSETLYQIGDYQCTSTINIDVFADILAGNFETTSDNVNATLKFSIFNIHAAAPASDPSGSPQAPNETDLPSQGSYLADVLNSTLASYVYTPDALSSQRTNLNTTWFHVDQYYWPVSAYLDIEPSADNDTASRNGWPDEAYVELLRTRRLLMGFGTIDSQMAAYDRATDDGTIFSSDQLTDLDQVSISQEGDVTGGCIFHADVTSLTASNSSFAVSENAFPPTPSLSLQTIMRAASNITSCGVSPVLNQTLNGQTADTNITAYASFVQSTIWSWKAGEPSDSISSNSSSDDSEYHCATLNTTASGKWQATSCSARLFAACRVGDVPYQWTISSQRGQYYQVDTACPDNSTFDTPRTALENSHLRAAIVATHIDDTLFWVNFNDIDTPGCWVNGVNSTCPYVATHNNATDRAIVVPVLSAVIVFVIAALTIFVKCASNRRSSKRKRKRGDGGWDYEGVPS